MQIMLLTVLVLGRVFRIGARRVVIRCQTQMVAIAAKIVVHLAIGYERDGRVVCRSEQAVLGRFVHLLLELTMQLIAVVTEHGRGRYLTL